MITKAIGLMILATAALVVVPATTQAQVNPALIGEGAAVWGNNCGRCHHTRPATERSDAEWMIILMQMRARANLTGHQAAAVLAYLQATNAPEGSAAAAAAAAAVENFQWQKARDGRDASASEVAPGSGTRSPPGQRPHQGEGVRERH